MGQRGRERSGRWLVGGDGGMETGMRSGVGEGWGGRWMEGPKEGQ